MFSSVKNIYFNKIMFKIKYIASDITIIYSNTLNFRLQHVHVRVKRSFSKRSSFIFRILRSSRHCGGEHVTVGIDLTWQKYLIKLEKYYFGHLRNGLFVVWLWCMNYNFNLMEQHPALGWEFLACSIE